MKTSANIEAVRKLCERWAWLSKKEFAELLAQNCIYYDVPFPRAQAVGPQAAHAESVRCRRIGILGLKSSLSSASGHRHSGASRALQEQEQRVEAFDLPVVGVFEIADGKIKAWRDYWDRSAAEPLLRFIAMSRGQRTT